MPTKAEVEAYLKENNVEETIQAVLGAVIKEGMHPNPIKLIGEKLLAASGAAVATKKPAPTGADMEKAKLLYVTLKMDYTSNPDVPNVDALKSALSDGGLTKVWAGVAGLRHKYFVYDKEEEVCSGVYVFYTEKALTDYMDSDLFKAQSTYPHVSKVTAASPLTHTPPLTPCLTHTPPRLEGYGGGQGRDARHRAGHREDGLGAHAPHARRRERRQAAHRRPHHGLHDRRGGCPPPPTRTTHALPPFPTLLLTLPRTTHAHPHSSPTLLLTLLRRAADEEGGALRLHGGAAKRHGIPGAVRYAGGAARQVLRLRRRPRPLLRLLHLCRPGVARQVRGARPPTPPPL